MESVVFTETLLEGGSLHCQVYLVLNILPEQWFRGQHIKHRFSPTVVSLSWMEPTIVCECNLFFCRDTHFLLLVTPVVLESIVELLEGDVPECNDVPVATLPCVFCRQLIVVDG
jgi:hypothetical protein